MSKEIVIKSPIKILTERSNCTQLNEGEIGIYQPPYRYKNDDGTLGDLKCKKVQMYTKINGQIMKSNEYKPTNFIHMKAVPFNGFPGEVYFTKYICKAFNFGVTKESKTVRLPNLSPTIYKDRGFTSESEFYQDRIIYEGYDFNNCKVLSDNLPEDTIRINYPMLTVTGQNIVIVVRIILKSNGSNIFAPKSYYKFIYSNSSKTLCECQKPNDKKPTMRGIKEYYFVKRLKLYYDPNFNKWSTSSKMAGRGLRRYARKDYEKIYGKGCVFYCKKIYKNKRTGYSDRWTRDKLKKVRSLPMRYFLRTKQKVEIPIQF